VCPVKINIPDMLLHLRHEIKEGGAVESRKDAPDEKTSSAAASTAGGRSAGRSIFPGTFPERLNRWLAARCERAGFRLWALAMKNKTRYRAGARLARVAQTFFGRRAANGHSVLPVSRWTATRELPSLPSRSFRELWPEINNETGNTTGHKEHRR
jgi:L-lactate utilization protein LutB